MFSVGIPLLYLLLMLRQRAEINPPNRSGSDKIDVFARNEREGIQHLRFLFEAYRPRYW